MAKIQLNGRKVSIKQKLSIFDLLKKHKIDDRKVAVELNGSIIGLSKSGFKIISDSLIAFQPAIEEPSKKTPLSSISSSTNTI